MLKNLYCIVGHSGSGKTTIVEELQKRFGYIPLASYTDRPKRHENETGHVFLSTEEFNMLDNILAYTMFAGHQYCATQELVDHSDLYVIDPEGIKFMKERYKSDRPIRVIGVSVPQDVLVKRMLARGDSEDKINTRLENDAVMFEEMDEVCDVIVKNDDLEETITTIESIINRYEGITNPGLKHVGIIDDYVVKISGVLEERRCALINMNRISEEEAHGILAAGEYSPFVLELPQRQFLALFKDKVDEPKPRLFVDMDGTLCKWKSIEQEEDLYTKDWFRTMVPAYNVVAAVHNIARESEVEVYILTAVIEGTYAKEEKIAWVKQYMPDFPKDHILFSPVGQPKHAYVPGGIRPTDVLLDDYSMNLHQWAELGKGIKIKTKHNGTKGTWVGAMVSDEMSPRLIRNALYNQCNIPLLNAMFSKAELRWALRRMKKLNIADLDDTEKEALRILSEYNNDDLDIDDIMDLWENDVDEEQKKGGRQRWGNVSSVKETSF